MKLAFKFKEVLMLNSGLLIPLGHTEKLSKGSFKNHVDTILLFFDHPPTSVSAFYVLIVNTR